MYLSLKQKPQSTERKTDKERKKDKSLAIIGSCNVLLSIICRKPTERISRYIEYLENMINQFHMSNTPLNNAINHSFKYMKLPKDVLTTEI